MKKNVSFYLIHCLVRILIMKRPSFYDAPKYQRTLPQKRHSPFHMNFSRESTRHRTLLPSVKSQWPSEDGTETPRLGACQAQGLRQYLLEISADAASMKRGNSHTISTPIWHKVLD